MLVILFGLAGSGKTFVGELMQQELGYYFWDADQALTLDMRERISKKQPFTQAMRDKFTQSVIKHIKSLRESYPKLVVAGALYKEKNRKMMQNQFKDAVFIQVQANLPLIIERLEAREYGIDEHYAQQIIVNFEEPTLPHYVLSNNADKTALLAQLNSIISS